MTQTLKNIRQLAWILLIGILLQFSLPVIAGGGHDHGTTASDEDHPHEDEGPANVVTQFNGITELFLEFPPLVVNETSVFVTHFTRLDDFKPVIEGSLDVVFTQNSQSVARFRVREAARKGIFLPDVVPNKTGRFNVMLELTTPNLKSVHDLGLVTVYSSKSAAKVELEAEEGEITYLKEQQWENTYAVINASISALRPSVPGFATVSPPLNEFTVIRAAEDGYYQSEQYLSAGSDVESDTLLGQLIPRLGEDSDVGDLIIETQRAKSALELAEADIKRLEKLFETGAVSEKAVLEAQKQLEDSQVEFSTAESRLKQRTSGLGQSGFQIRSPISGAIMEAHVLPGSFVREGDALFSVAGKATRWLKIQVPEHYGASVQQTTGLWFEQSDEIIEFIVNKNATAINTGQLVKQPSRTIETVIEYSADSWNGIMGSRLPVNVFVGETQNKLSIPVTSIIDDGGIPVVYVLSSGESFQRRVVTLGMRDGQYIEVISGLADGEWVVSSGAYFVKLASASGDSIGHGHAH